MRNYFSLFLTLFFLYHLSCLVIERAIIVMKEKRKKTMTARERIRRYLVDVCVCSSPSAVALLSSTRTTTEQTEINNESSYAIPVVFSASSSPSSPSRIESRSSSAYSVLLDCVVSWLGVAICLSIIIYTGVDFHNEPLLQ